MRRTPIPLAAGLSVAPALLTVALAVPSLAGASGARAAASHPRQAATTRQKRKHPVPLLRSPLLWATVDACNPPDRPGTIGIRGSMPGDGKAREQMYMRFRVQYQDPSTGGWRYVAGADSSYVRVGPGSARARQAGRNFQFRMLLLPPPYRPRYLLRGWLDFQWKLKRKLVRAAARSTSAHHPSGFAGDPPGYSAATCTLQ
jgi:hypothetical protein